ATAIAGEAWQSSSPASDTTATWATGGLTLNTATGSSTTLSQAWTFTPATADVGTSVGEFASQAPDASFELWLKPTDLVGGELLFETGGNGKGLAIALFNDQVVVLLKDASGGADSEVVLTETLSASDIGDFLQVVVTTDGASSHNLYVNAVGATDAGVIDASSSLAFGDFGGSNAAQIGTAGQIGGSQNAGGTDVAGNDPIDRNPSYAGFDGDIGLFRVYNDVLTAEEVAENFAATVPEPGTLVLLAAGTACVRTRRRLA
ncbi:MAG: LamG-like jellyroll fold domain-containing protein, partial [Planctomycetota bacterium]